MITNKCPTCYKEIKSPDEQRGLKSKCPVCGDAFVVGSDDADDDEAFGLADEPKRPAVAKSSFKATAKAPPAKPKAAKPEPPQDESELPEGKVECPTCHELISAAIAQCPYCGDLVQRGGGKKKFKRR